MNKEALFSQYTPTEILLNTALVGGGSFAAMRLLKDILTQATQQGKTEDTKNNALTVDIPRAHPQVIDPNLQKIAAGTLEGILAAGAGGVGGFMGTKMLYDAWRKKQMKHEVDKAEASYLKTLEDVSKTASDSTPNIDKWCEKTAEYLNEKRATSPLAYLSKMRGASKAVLEGTGKLVNKVPIVGPLTTGAVKGTANFAKDYPYLTGLGSVAGAGKVYADMHPQSAIGQQVNEIPASAGAISEVGRNVAGGDSLWKTWGMAGGSMAVLALAALINSHNKKIHKEDKQPPANVAINYV